MPRVNSPDTDGENTIASRKRKIRRGSKKQSASLVQDVGTGDAPEASNENDAAVDQDENEKADYNDGNTQTHQVDISTSSTIKNKNSKSNDDGDFNFRTPSPHRTRKRSRLTSPLPSSNNRINGNGNGGNNISKNSERKLTVSRKRSNINKNKNNESTISSSQQNNSDKKGKSTTTASPQKSPNNNNSSTSSPSSSLLKQKKKRRQHYSDLLSEAKDLMGAVKEAQMLGRLKLASVYLVLLHARLSVLGRIFDKTLATDKNFRDVVREKLDMETTTYCDSSKGEYNDSNNVMISPVNANAGTGNGVGPATATATSIIPNTSTSTINNALPTDTHEPSHLLASNNKGDNEMCVEEETSNLSAASLKSFLPKDIPLDDDMMEHLRKAALAHHRKRSNQK